MTRRKLTWVALIGAMALLISNFAPAFQVVNTPTVEASSHREAPLISQDPVADATDLYAFVSPDAPDTVTFLTNWIPYQSPAGGPNWFKFGDDVLYELHIDNVGDAQDRIVFQFRFNTVVVNPNTFLYATGPIGSPYDAQLNQRQYMSVTRLDAPADGSCKNKPLANCTGAKSTLLGKDIIVAPANIGPSSIPVYSAVSALSVATLNNGAKAFAGPRADPFFLDLGAFFDLLTIRKLPGNAGGGVNAFDGYNVSTIALQIPISQLTNNGARPTNPADAASVLGTWITSSRRTTKVYADFSPTANLTSSTGDWIQIERLGMPLVNEIVVPLALKDAFNNLKPWQDATIPAVVNLITDPEPARLLTALYGIKVPPTPRNDILAVFATGVKGLNQPPNVVPSEMLRLNVAIPPTAAPSRLGVLGGDLGGFPNGRRPIDDVVDISERVVAGVLVDGYNISPNNVLGDGVDASVNPFLGSFPYLALPLSGYYYPGNALKP